MKKMVIIFVLGTFLASSTLCGAGTAATFLSAEARDSSADLSRITLVAAEASTRAPDIGINLATLHIPGAPFLHKALSEELKKYPETRPESRVREIDKSTEAFHFKLYLLQIKAESGYATIAALINAHIKDFFILHAINKAADLKEEDFSSYIIVYFGDAGTKALDELQIIINTTWIK